MSDALSDNSRVPISIGQKMARRPYTIAAAIFLIFNAIRFMIIKDFSEWDNVFVLAARHLRSGIDIYSVVPQAQDHAYSYPPFMALLAIPFTYIPPVAAKFIWFLINAVLAVVVWRGAWQLSGGKPLEPANRAPTAEHIIAVLGLLCAMRFMEDNFNHRQTDLVIAALLLSGCFAWQSGRDFVAATFFGLAAATKGPALLFAPYLAWRGRVSAVWLVIVAVAVNLLPDIVHRAPEGIWLTHWYATMIKPIGEIGIWHGDVINNQSLSGAAHRWFSTSLSPTTLKRIVYSIEMALVMIVAWVFGRPGLRPRDSSTPPTPHILECCVIFGLMLLISPMSSGPHFCIMLLPAFCVARYAVQRKNPLARAAIAFCITAVIILDRGIIGRQAGIWTLWLGSVMWGSIALTFACLSFLAAKSSTALPYPPTARAASKP